MKISIPFCTFQVNKNILGIREFGKTLLNFTRYEKNVVQVFRRIVDNILQHPVSNCYEILTFASKIFWQRNMTCSFRVRNIKHLIEMLLDWTHSNRKYFCSCHSFCGGVRSSPLLPMMQQFFNIRNDTEIYL